MTSTGDLTTKRIGNGEFEVFWNGQPTRYRIEQTGSLWGAHGGHQYDRRAPRYAIYWTGKDGEPKYKMVGALHAAKRLLAQRLAACKAGA